MFYKCNFFFGLMIGILVINNFSSVVIRVRSYHSKYFQCRLNFTKTQLQLAIASDAQLIKLQNLCTLCVQAKSVFKSKNITCNLKLNQKISRHTFDGLFYDFSGQCDYKMRVIEKSGYRLVRLHDLIHDASITKLREKRIKNWVFLHLDYSTVFYINIKIISKWIGWRSMHLLKSIKNSKHLYCWKFGIFYVT
jgi:hypothetical protein